MKSKFSINVVRNMDCKSMVNKFGIANPEQRSVQFDEQYKNCSFGFVIRTPLTRDL